MATAWPDRGRLLELARLEHRAQPWRSARAETRRRAGEPAALVRQRTSAEALLRLRARLVELGFTDDVAGFCLTDTSVAARPYSRWLATLVSATAIRAELDR